MAEYIDCTCHESCDCSLIQEDWDAFKSADGLTFKDEDGNPMKNEDGSDMTIWSINEVDADGTHYECWCEHRQVASA